MSKDDEKSLVLMIDDDPDFKSIVRDWISPQYNYASLPNGDDLIDEISGIEPNLIIMDVRMPGPDGFTLCRQIRADQRFNEIPILFLTGCKEDEDFFKHLKVGGTAYLTKPIARKQLLSTLNDLVR